MLSPSDPRERAAQHGIAVLGDTELLAILLGTGGLAVAAALLDRFHGLEGIARQSVSALAEHPGVGRVKALRVLAALEMGRRAWRRLPVLGARISSSAQVAAHMGPSLESLDHEELWLLSLDGTNHLRSARKVAQGGLHACAVSPRDLLRVALHEVATSFVLVHNHPGGDPTPSTDDVAMSRQVAAAAAIVGVPLVDHVVLTPAGEYSSMLARGLLQPDLTDARLSGAQLAGAELTAPGAPS